jgi:hypothetical protein
LESEAFPLELFSSQLDIDCFTQGQMSDMAQLLGAKELHSFVVYLLRAYDYVYDTEVDLWSSDRYRDLLVHYLLMRKL